MQHGDAAIKLGLHFGIAGGREIHLAELDRLAGRPRCWQRGGGQAGGKQYSFQWCVHCNSPWCSCDGSVTSLQLIGNGLRLFRKPRFFAVVRLPVSAVRTCRRHKCADRANQCLNMRSPDEGADALLELEGLPSTVAVEAYTLSVLTQRAGVSYPAHPRVVSRRGRLFSRKNQLQA